MYHLYHHQLQIALFYGRLFSFSHTTSESTEKETTHKCVMEYIWEKHSLFKNYFRV